MEPQSQDTVEAKSSNLFFQVTPLSKYLAMALFIALPFIGGWVGYKLATEKSVTSEVLVLPEIENQNKDDDISVESDLNVKANTDQDIPEGYKIHTDTFHGISFFVPNTWLMTSAAEGGQPGVGSPEYVALFNNSETLRNQSGAAVFYDLYTVPEGFMSVDEYIGNQKGNIEATAVVHGGWREIKTAQGYSIFVGKIVNPNSSEYLSVWGKIGDRALWLGFRNLTDDEAFSLIESINIAQ